MTPKEKAEELFAKMYTVHPNIYPSSAKQCALVAVDEILEMVDKTMQGWLDADIVAHWKQVKQEIQKL